MSNLLKELGIKDSSELEDIMSSIKKTIDFTISGPALYHYVGNQLQLAVDTFIETYDDAVAPRDPFYGNLNNILIEAGSPSRLGTPRIFSPFEQARAVLFESLGDVEERDLTARILAYRALSGSKDPYLQMSARAERAHWSRHAAVRFSELPGHPMEIEYRTTFSVAPTIPQRVGNQFIERYASEKNNDALIRQGIRFAIATYIMEKKGL